MATNTYRLQSTFLRIKPEIDRAQHTFLSVFLNELDSLLNESNQTKERLRAERLVLRQQLHSQQLEQKQYAAPITPLQKEAEQCGRRHYCLQVDINYELTGIKMELIKRVLDAKINQSPLLPVTNRE